METQTRFLFKPKIRRQIPSSQIPAARTSLLVPFDFRSAAPARPFSRLGFQPLRQAVFPDIFQVRFHGPVVRPFVIHEFMERRAWIFITKAAEIDMSICGALPEPASSDIFIRAVAAAAIAVRGSAGAAI